MRGKKPKKAIQRKPRARKAPAFFAQDLPPPSDSAPRKGRVRELGWAEFDRLVQDLARRIASTYRPTSVVGIAHGGVFVGGAVASALSCDFYPVRISRRSRDRVARSNPRMFGHMPKELKGQSILVVDDIAASGDTFELAKALAENVGAKRIETASLVARSGRYQPTWKAQETEDVVVFPWDYTPVAEDGRFDVDPERAGA